MQIVFRVLFFSFLLSISYASSVCMTDCTNLLTPCPPSIYEQYCYNSDNSGKTINRRENNRVKLTFVLAQCHLLVKGFLLLQTVQKFLKRTIQLYLDITEWMDLMALFFLSIAM